MIVYRETETLAADLGFSKKSLYSLTNNIGRHYKTVRLEKRGGGYRQLLVPDSFLKAVQRQILQKLLLYMPVSKYASAYCIGASIQKNAALHCGRKKVFKLDIAHCFDSVMYSQVKNIFSEKIFSEQNRVLLAMLCYHNDVLPQGAPTSPAVLNIIFYDFDEKVGAFCAERGISYTRYSDDMIFSGDFDTNEVYTFVKSELCRLGFRINVEKTFTAGRAVRQTVTGLIVNDKVSAPPEYRKKVRQELYYCRKFGVSEHIARLGLEDGEKYLQSLLGRVNFILQSGGGAEFAAGRDWILEQMK